MRGLKPSDALPLDPSVFARAVLVAIAAGEAADGDAEGGGAIELGRAGSNPQSRAGFALRRHFGDDDRAFKSAFLRFRALMDLYARGVLAPWIRERAGNRSAIHPAALDVASRLRLSRNGRFAPRKFLEQVALQARAYDREPLD